MMLTKENQGAVPKEKGKRFSGRQKQETFTIILWSCALAAQGSWPGRVWLLCAQMAPGSADIPRGPHSRVWRLLHVGLGDGNGMATRIQRPPGFAHVPKCRVPRAARQETSSSVWAHFFLKTLLFSAVLCPQWNWTENREGSHRPLSLLSLQYYQQPLLLLLSHFSRVRLCDPIDGYVCCNQRI